MSEFRRNLLKMGGVERLKDITDRYESMFRIRCSEVVDVGDKMVLRGDNSWTALEIPKDRDLFVEVSKYGPTSNWQTGLIKYVDEDDIVVGWDANCTDDDSNQVAFGEYTRFKLKFTNGAVKAYVCSPHNNQQGGKFPPKVLKKII